MDYETNNGMVRRKLVLPEVIFFVLLVLVQLMMVIINGASHDSCTCFTEFKKTEK